MSTVEIAAVAAAVVVVLIILIVLIARGRKRGGQGPKLSAGDEGSMFDSPPSDTLAKLGRPEQRGEAPSIAPAEEPLAEEAELGPGEPEPSAEVQEADEPPAEPAQADEAAAVEAEPLEDTASEVPAEGNFVALSSIIVTTSNKIVDLDDPEIRRMLTDLVTFEIDQAQQFREQGQTIDAVLQLTEAEKICRALGQEDTAGEIRAMMRELQA